MKRSVFLSSFSLRASEHLVFGLRFVEAQKNFETQLAKQNQKL